MLISEKQKNMSWQIKTKDGQYYQSDSLASLYMWVFDARLCPDDFMFSAKNNNWIELANMPELTYCFWQLLGSDGAIYGPVSAGELKQLYLGKQVSSGDKIAVYGNEAWKEIKNLPALNRWMDDIESPVLDYIQLVEKIHDEYTLKFDSKENASEKTQIVAQEDSDQKKSFNELESVKSKLEQDLSARNKALEDISEKADKYKSEYDFIQEELKLLRIDLQEKTLLIEQLNKQNAQAEVTHTLKDDEINQMRSNLKLLQFEIQNLHETGDKAQGSVSDVSINLNAAIGDLQNTVTRLSEEKENLNKKILALESLIAEKENIIAALNDAKSDKIKQLSADLLAKDAEIRDLNKKAEDKSSEIYLYKEDVKKLQDELKKAEKTIKENDSVVKELKDILSLKEGDVSEFSNRVAEKDEKIGSLQSAVSDREEQINRLRDNLSVEIAEKGRLLEEIENIKSEYNTKLKNIEESHSIQKTDLENELNQKNRSFEEMLRAEKEELEAIQGLLTQKDSQIEMQKTEINILQDAAISQDKQWQDKLREAKDETAGISEQMENERDSLRAEFSQQILALSKDKEELIAKAVELENMYNQLIRERDNLRNEMLNKNKTLESVKEDSRKQEEVYQIKIQDLAQQVEQLREHDGVLRQEITDLGSKIQNNIVIEEGLRSDISSLNKELEDAKQIANKIQAEKDDIYMQLSVHREEFEKIKLDLQAQLEDAKRNLEHAEEENRSSQRQFYLEKQKITKEYNETINKMDKLQKRTQLEREIQDRSKMKIELERLYNALKENFEGIQRGAAEIESSCRNLNEDIDNKNLSLKYLIETEKRETKKGQFSKSDSSEEADS